MGLREIVTVVRRRWYVVIPLVLVTACAVALLYRGAASRYISQTTILLTVPPTGATGFPDAVKRDESNPLVLDGPGVSLAASLVVQRMNTVDFRDEIGFPDDGSSTLKVTNGADNPELLVSGPFVFVTVESDSPTTALQTLRRAVQEAHRGLDEQQRTVGAQPETIITFTEVVAPSSAFRGHGGGVRPAATGLVLGILLTVAAAVKVDIVLNSRRRRLGGIGPGPYTFEQRDTESMALP
jgi:hypothetical protein